MDNKQIYSSERHTLFLARVQQGITEKVEAIFKNMHTREEVSHKISQMAEEVREGHYDGLLDLDSKIRELLSVTVPEFKTLLEEDEKKPLSKRAFQYVYNEAHKAQIEQAITTYSQYAKKMPTIDQLDKVFLGYLQEHYREYKSSADMMTRLVHHRLADISPEFVCVKALAGEKSDELGYKLDADGKREIKTECSTRLLILKQFIKQFHWCPGVVDVNQDKKNRGYQCRAIKEIAETRYDGSYDDMAAGITEEIFDELPTDGKNRVKHARIVKVANDLAAGFFASSGSTKESLYIFAIAFEMTASRTPLEELKEDDPEYYTDISKNLFYDYYSSNLINSYSVEIDDSKKQRSSRNVDGYGINYKNMVEVIYLYFLLKEDMSPLDKFVKARDTITTCKDSSKAKTFAALSEKVNVPYENENTRFYADTFYDELLRLDESHFTGWILRVFECAGTASENAIENRTIRLALRAKNGEGEEQRDASKDGAPPSFRYSSEHRTAFSFFEVLIHQVCKLCYDAFAAGGTREKNKYFDFSFSATEVRGDEDFTKVLKAFNQLMGIEKKKRRHLTEEGNPKLDGENAVAQTVYNYDGTISIMRTDLLAAFSSYVVATVTSSLRRDQLTENFSDFFDFYCQHCRFTFDFTNSEYLDGVRQVNGADDLLRQCGFQVISPKNIFDLMLIYLTFKKCRMLIGGQS